MRYSTMIRCVGGKTPENFFAFLDYLRETPFTAVNLSFNDTPWLFEDGFDVGGFIRRFRAYGFGLRFAHGPMAYPALFDRSPFRAIDGRVLKGLDLAAAFGVAAYTIHPGSVVDDGLVYDREASAERNVAYLRPFVAKAAELGVTVGLENGINQPWDDPELPLRQISPDFDELITVVDALRDEFGRDAVGVCFDTGHCHIAGLDPYRELKKIGGRLCMTHVHANDGDRDRHLPVGEGTFDWGGFRRGLAEIGYDGELSLELYYESEIWEGDAAAYLTKTYRGLRGI